MPFIRIFMQQKNFLFCTTGETTRFQNDVDVGLQRLIK